MTAAADKPTLRRQFRALRREALAAATPGLRAAATAQLPALLPPGLRLGLYWPLGGEPDLQPLAPGGLAEHLGPGRLALPAVLPASADEPWGPLVYLPWQPEAPLRPDACGIPAPLPHAGRLLEASSAAAPPAAVAPFQTGAEPSQPPTPLRPAAALPPGQLGLLLVPALALDGRGIRLGSGGGWYDRLRADPAWRAVPALAVLPAACHCQVLPRDPWDVPFDGWLDERGIGWLAGPRQRSA
jgi:5-formyltetrahydrofolate cyclo-ligase